MQRLFQPLPLWGDTAWLFVWSVRYTDFSPIFADQTTGWSCPGVECIILVDSDGQYLPLHIRRKIREFSDFDHLCKFGNADDFHDLRTDYWSREKWTERIQHIGNGFPSGDFGVEFFRGTKKQTDRGNRQTTSAWLEIFDDLYFDFLFQWKRFACLQRIQHLSRRGMADSILYFCISFSVFCCAQWHWQCFYVCKGKRQIPFPMSGCLSLRKHCFVCSHTGEAFSYRSLPQ